MVTGHYTHISTHKKNPTYPNNSLQGSPHQDSKLICCCDLAASSSSDSSSSWPQIGHAVQYFRQTRSELVCKMSISPPPKYIYASVAAGWLVVQSECCKSSFSKNVYCRRKTKYTMGLQYDSLVDHLPSLFPFVRPAAAAEQLSNSNSHLKLFPNHVFLSIRTIPPKRSLPTSHRLKHLPTNITTTAPAHHHHMAWRGSS